VIRTFVFVGGGRLGTWPNRMASATVPWAHHVVMWAAFILSHK